jgi:DNA-binding response OmpR family regulator
MHVILFSTDGSGVDPLVRTFAGHRIDSQVARSLEHTLDLLQDKEAVAIIVVHSGSPTLLGHIWNRILAEHPKALTVTITKNQSSLDRAAFLGLGVKRYYIQPFYHSHLIGEVVSHSSRMKDPRIPAVLTQQFTLDLVGREAKYKEKALTLTKTEFDLLAALIRRRGSVLTRLQLWEEVWGYESYPLANTIDVHMNRLRRKLPAEAARQIRTIYGVGYQFLTEPELAEPLTVPQQLTVARLQIH